MFKLKLKSFINDNLKKKIINKSFFDFFQYIYL